MTTPGKFPFDLAPIDLTRFCCADPLGGGCGHDLTEHTGGAGECRGVFGCNCQGFVRHRPRCIHSDPDPEGEVSTDDEA